MSRPGPEFWQSQFGIGTYDEFFSRIEAWMPASVGYIIQIKDEQWARLAYENPFSAPGTWALTVLKTAELTGNDGTKTADASRRALGGALQAGAAGMAVLVIPNVYRVGIYGRAGGQPVVNVVGVRGSASGQQVGARDAVRTAWKVASGPLSQLPPAYALEKFSAMDLSSIDGGISEIADVSAGTATASAFATLAASALVKWNGGTRNGSGRGRMYFGPLTESKINADGRTIDASYAVTLQTALQNFRNSLEGAGFPLVVISPTRQIATTVTSHSVESVIASQRRRIRD